MSAYSIDWDGRNLVLPSTANDAMDGAEIYTSDDQAPALKRYLQWAKESNPGVRRPIRVALRLTPRPDNNYNQYAVAVTVPDELRQLAGPAHIGFLLDRYLWRVGPTKLSQLARYSGGELICTGLITGRGLGELRVDLPAPRILSEAIDRFLRRSDVPQLRSLPLLIGESLRIERGAEQTERLVQIIEKFPHQRQPVRGLRLKTREAMWGQVRPLAIYDDASGRYLGEVARGVLLLWGDERDRADVLGLLAGMSIDVAAPRGSVSEESVTNVFATNMERSIALRVHDPDGVGTGTVFANYNPHSRVLWVEDARLAEPARIAADRIGLTVDDIRTPYRPWSLEDEFWWSERLDYETVPRKFDQGVPQHFLRRAVYESLPTDLFDLWLDRIELIDAQVRKSNEPRAELAVRERYVDERHMFGMHSLTGEVGPCRLCGLEAAAFRTPACSEVLAYCQACMAHAIRGLTTTRERTVEAIQHLATREFNGEAMAELQLQTIRFDPDQPRDAAEIDQLLVLRWAVRHRRWAWTRLLLDANLGGGGIRLARGTVVKASDGHLCLSMSEKVVDDFLHSHGIQHEREPLYPFDPELNANGKRRADWILADGTLIEFWGMPSNPEYASKMAEKQRLASRFGIPLVGLTEPELPKLRELFAAWLTSASHAAAGYAESDPATIPPRSPVYAGQLDQSRQTGPTESLELQ